MINFVVTSFWKGSRKSPDMFKSVFLLGLVGQMQFVLYIAAIHFPAWLSFNRTSGGEGSRPQGQRRRPRGNGGTVLPKGHQKFWADISLYEI